MKRLKVTDDGVYLLNKHKNARSVIYASGTAGSASAKLVYKDSDDVHIDLQDANITAGEQLQITHGLNVNIYVSVSGSTGSTSLEFVCSGVD